MAAAGKGSTRRTNCPMITSWFRSSTPYPTGKPPVTAVSSGGGWEPDCADSMRRWGRALPRALCLLAFVLVPGYHVGVIHVS